MSNRRPAEQQQGGAADWRSKISSFVESTDYNLQAARRDANAGPPARTFRPPPLDISGRGQQRGGSDAVASARGELSSLLAAVQGSLADLRVEVAAAKRLSNDATAAVTEMSPAPKPPPVRSGSQGRIAMPRDHSLAQPMAFMPHPPPGHMAASYPMAAFPAAAMYAPVYPGAGMAGHDTLLLSPRSLPPPTPGEDIVKALDQRLIELGQKIERSIDEARQQQLMQQHQQQREALLRTSMAPPPAPYEGSAGTAPSPLVLLSMSKADTAEKVSSEVKTEVTALEKHVSRTSEDFERRLSSLHDLVRQHWDRICQVSSQMDSLSIHRQAAADNQSDISRLTNRLQQLESAHDRAVSSLEEQKSLMRQLTTAMQQVTAEGAAARANATGRQDDMASRLDEALRRLQDMEAKVAQVQSRPPPLIAPPPVDESIMQRISDLERRMGPPGSSTSPGPEPSAKRLPGVPEKQQLTKMESHTSTASSLPPVLAGWLGEAVGTTSTVNQGPKHLRVSFATDRRSLGGVGQSRFSSLGGEGRDMESRIRSLEDFLENFSFSGTTSNTSATRALQTLNARIERIEQIIRAENSIEAMAQEARLAVAEEFVLELRRDFHDVVGPTLEKLAQHVSELRKAQGDRSGSPEASKIYAELRAMQARIDAATADITALSAAQRAAAQGGPGTQEARLKGVEMNVQTLSAVLQDHADIFARVAEQEQVLKRLGQDVEHIKAGLAADVSGLNERALQLDRVVDTVQGQLAEAQQQMGALDERLAALGELVEELDDKVETAAAAVKRRSSSGGAGTAAAAAVGAGLLGGGVAAGLAAGTAPSNTAHGLGQAAAQGLDPVQLQDMASAEDLLEVQAKVSELRTGLREARAELGGRLQALDAQVHELLAFREQAQSEYMELQEGLERAAGTADVTARAAAEQQTRVEQLAAAVEEVRHAAEAAAVSADEANAAVIAGRAMTRAAPPLEAAVDNARVEELAAAVEEVRQVAESAAASAEEAAVTAAEASEAAAAASEAAAAATAAVASVATRHAADDSTRVEELAEAVEEVRQVAQSAASAAEEAAVAAAAASAAAAAATAAASAQASGGDARVEELAAAVDEVRLMAEVAAADSVRVDDLTAAVDEVRQKADGAAAAAAEAVAKVESAAAVSAASLPEAVEEQSARVEELAAAVEEVRQVAQSAAATAEEAATAAAAATAASETRDLSLDQEITRKMDQLAADSLEHQGMLEALEAKVQELHDLVLSTAQDNASILEVGNRVSEVNKDLGQMQESVGTLSSTVALLKAQLADVSQQAVHATTAATAASHAAAAAHNELDVDGLRRLEERVTEQDGEVSKLHLGLDQLRATVASISGLGGPVPSGSGVRSLRTSLGGGPLSAVRASPPPAELLAGATTYHNDMYEHSDDAHEDGIDAGAFATRAAPPGSLTPGSVARFRLGLGDGPSSGGFEEIREAPSEESSVRDKAMYFEQLAAASAAGGARTSGASAVSGSSATPGPSPAPAAAPASAADNRSGNLSSENSMDSLEALSPPLRRRLPRMQPPAEGVPETTMVPQAPAPSPSAIPTGAVAAARAARSGNIPGDEDDEAAVDVGAFASRAAPSSAAAPQVFGREGTFRDGFADEQHSVSSDSVASDGKPTEHGAGREEVFKAGATDEALSLSSGDDDGGGPIDEPVDEEYSDDVVGGDEEAGEEEAAEDAADAGEAGEGFDDDDEENDGSDGGLELPDAGDRPSQQRELSLTPVAAAAAAGAAAGVTAAVARRGTSGAGNEDENEMEAEDDIEFEPGLQAGGFDHDDDDEFLPAALAPSPPLFGKPLAAPNPPKPAEIIASLPESLRNSFTGRGLAGTEEVSQEVAAAAKAAAEEATTSAPPPPPDAPAAAPAPAPVLAPYPLLGNPLGPRLGLAPVAGLTPLGSELGTSTESMGMRRRPLPPLGASGGLAALSGNLSGNLSTSQGLDDVLLRPHVGSAAPPSDAGALPSGSAGGAQPATAQDAGPTVGASSVGAGGAAGGDAPASAAEPGPQSKTPAPLPRTSGAGGSPEGSKLPGPGEQSSPLDRSRSGRSLIPPAPPAGGRSGPLDSAQLSGEFSTSRRSLAPMGAAPNTANGSGAAGDAGRAQESLQLSGELPGPLGGTLSSRRLSGNLAPLGSQPVTGADSTQLGTSAALLSGEIPSTSGQLTGLRSLRPSGSGVIGGPLDPLQASGDLGPLGVRGRGLAPLSLPGRSRLPPMNSMSMELSGELEAAPRPLLGSAPPVAAPPPAAATGAAVAESTNPQPGDGSGRPATPSDVLLMAAPVGVLRPHSIVPPPLSPRSMALTTAAQLSPGRSGNLVGQSDGAEGSNPSRQVSQPPSRRTTGPGIAPSRTASSIVSEEILSPEASTAGRSNPPSQRPSASGNVPTMAPVSQPARPPSPGSGIPRGPSGKSLNPQGSVDSPAGSAARPPSLQLSAIPAGPGTNVSPRPSPRVTSEDGGSRNLGAAAPAAGSPGDVTSAGPRASDGGGSKRSLSVQLDAAGGASTAVAATSATSARQQLAGTSFTGSSAPSPSVSGLSHNRSHFKRRVSGASAALSVSGVSRGGADMSMDLEGLDETRDAVAEQSLSSFDAPPELPGMGGGEGSVDPGQSAADMGKLISDNSLARLMPPDDEMFASSSDVSALGGLSVGSGSEPSDQQTAQPLAAAMRVSQGSGRDAQQRLSAAGGGMSSPSDFDGQVSMEADRLAAMLAAPKRASQAGLEVQASGTSARSSQQQTAAGPGDDDADYSSDHDEGAGGDELQAGSEAEGAEVDDGAGSAVSGLDSSGMLADLGLEGAGAPGGAAPDDGLVHGSLEFDEDDGEGSSSSSVFGAAAAAAAGGLSGGADMFEERGGASDSDSMELEIFKPPPAAGSQSRPPIAQGRVLLPGQKSPRTAGVTQPLLSIADTSATTASYRIAVVTGNKPQASCAAGAAVSLKLYGSEGSHAVEVPVDQPSGQLRFQRGASDEFFIDSGQDLGELAAVHVTHSAEGFSSSWLVESVTVEQVMTGLDWIFPIGDWVRGGAHGGRVVKLPNAALSLSRENSLNRLAGAMSPGGGPSREHSGAGLVPPSAVRNLRYDSGSSQQPASAVPAPLRRGLAAMADESMELSSELPSASASQEFGAIGGRSAPPAQGSDGRQSGTSGDGGSLNFDDDGDGDDDLLAGMGIGSGGSASNATAGGAKLPPTGKGARASSAASAHGATRMASNVPSGIGVVLEEDLEEVDEGRFSTGLGLGPVRGGGSMVSPKPPLPPGALPGRHANPPTPPLGRRSSGGLSSSGLGGRRGSGDLQPEYSSESVGSAGRRRVRIQSDDGELAPELSVEASEVSTSGASVASLSMYAPDGVRPPAQQGGVEFQGTSRKRVSWADYAEEIELPRDVARGGEVSDGGSSVAEMTEDELLEAQGTPLGATRFEGSEVGYRDMMRGGASSPPGAQAGAAGASSSGPEHPSSPGPGTFLDVPLKRRSTRQNAYAYKLKVFTADKMNAGIGNTTVHVELMGRDATVSQTLPKEKGCFQRGCVDRFTLYSHSGDMGPLLALKVWHEGKTLGPGNWGLAMVVIDDRLKGTRYVFSNQDPDCVLRKGRLHCLVMKPATQRIDESEDLLEVAKEYETQLKANRGLSDADKRSLQGKLEKINTRLTKFGVKIARTLSGKRTSSSSSTSSG